MQRVYIAGPLSGEDLLDNIHRFIVTDRELRRHGFAPFNPALDFQVGIAFGDMKYEDYTKPNLAWVPVANTLLSLGNSPGANREMAAAVKHGIPIVHSIGELLRLNEGV